MNVFVSVKTAVQPWSNYRGENENNSSIIQKITYRIEERAIIGPCALRQALRDALQGKKNRYRVEDENQLTVRYKDIPNIELYIDDKGFGYMVIYDKNKKLIRRSVIRVNMGLSSELYKNETLFQQAPRTEFVTKNGKIESNSKNSSLLNSDIIMTSFEFPFSFC
jgi:CRISPR-associated protein Cst2